MDLNVLTEVGLLTIALGHLKQIFFQDSIQGSEICFKPAISMRQSGTENS